MDKEEEKSNTLTDQERLLRHQLNATHYWQGKSGSKIEANGKGDVGSLSTYYFCHFR